MTIIVYVIKTRTEIDLCVLASVNCMGDDLCVLASVNCMRDDIISVFIEGSFL